LAEVVGRGFFFSRPAAARRRYCRKAYLCELDPVYCDRIIRRWQIYAKDDGLLESTGESFAEVAENRKDNNTSQMADDSHLGHGWAGGTSSSGSSTSPPPDSDDHLVCWLPPFHPAYVGVSASAGVQPVPAAE
jgi:hypothetical protein